MYSTKLLQLRKKIRKWEHGWNKEDSHDMKARAKSPKICALSIFFKRLWNPVVNTIQENSLESFISSVDYQSLLSLVTGLHAVHAFYRARNHNVKMQRSFQILQLQVESLSDLESKKVLEHYENPLVFIPSSLII